jgi:hypothetical protein
MPEGLDLQSCSPFFDRYSFLLIVVHFGPSVLSVAQDDDNTRSNNVEPQRRRIRNVKQERMRCIRI